MPANFCPFRLIFIFLSHSADARSILLIADDDFRSVLGENAILLLRWFYA